ncbi:hypothetical protein CC1G_14179 [Coprinopsis cinerea okayama7|uniref:Uncharacterized protein n=1 Tax=Coprinopsis cinerea (strain Okayama-7 / 130 / ATCC MYA-4618 / FGSC 9003) TaxID=240176 RepID=D6RLC5_COPC7|nr:hypothetical protein CC1G_14179 [Coprinopsis cinerea okayama7\|eukprot:XP_002911646.1 hypothetical protein CC1G_14179 [Coprinopsis cinerea okayama7\
MSAGVGGGAAIGWAGWMGWLVQNGDGLLGSIGLDPNTAMAVGALSAVTSIRWAVGRWEKGKRKWWADWQRVAEGLDRDLRSALHRNFKDRVSLLAQTSSNGVRNTVQQREEEIAQVNDEVGQLRKEVKAVMEQS